MSSRFPTPFQVFFRAVAVWWDNWYLMIGLTIIWIASWLTIVLGPPTTFAIYGFVRQILEKETPGWRGIISDGKHYFLKSWGWLLTNLIVAIIIYSNQTFYSQLESSLAEILKLISLVAFLLWLGIQFYALPYFILQEKKSILLALRNGLFTLLAYPFYSSVLLFLTILILGLSILTVIPILIGIPMLTVFIGSLAVSERINNLKNKGPETDKV
ncbi:hypothetical protein ACFLUC_01815 [Chloroflexota bacterium]